MLFKRKPKEKQIAGRKPAPKKGGTKLTAKKTGVKKPTPQKKVGKTAARKPMPRKQVGKPTARKNASVKPQKRAVAHKNGAAKKTGNKEKLVSVTVKKHRDRNGNHNHVILESFEDKHVSVGLTTQAKKGRNSTNYRLEKDTLDIGQKGYKPKKVTYMRRQGTVAKKTDYFQERKGSMVKKDYKKAVEYGNTAKEKFLQKKSNGSAKHVNQSPSARGSKTTRPLLNRKITKLKPNVKKLK